MIVARVRVDVEECRTLMRIAAFFFPTESGWPDPGGEGLRELPDIR